MMELGQTVCLPRAPLCDSCPLSVHCQARAQRTAHVAFAARQAPRRRALRPSASPCVRDSRRASSPCSAAPSRTCPHLWLPPIRFRTARRRDRNGCGANVPALDPAPRLPGRGGPEGALARRSRAPRAAIDRRRRERPLLAERSGAHRPFGPPHQGAAKRRGVEVSQAAAQLAPAPDDSPFFWGMTRYQWIVFFAAWLGWGFDVFDGLLFNFVAPVCVPRLLGVAPGDPRVSAVHRRASPRCSWSAGRRAASSSASSPTGSDARARSSSPCSPTRSRPRRARSRPTSGRSPRFRFVAALGIGGEWAAGASLVAEVVPERAARARRARSSTPARRSASSSPASSNDLFTQADRRPSRRTPTSPGGSSSSPGSLPAAVRALDPPPRARARGLAARARPRTPRLARAVHARDLRRATLGGLAMCARHARHLVGDERLPAVRGRAPRRAPARRRQRSRGTDHVRDALLQRSAASSARSPRSRSRASAAGRSSRSTSRARRAAIWTTFGLDWDPVDAHPAPLLRRPHRLRRRRQLQLLPAGALPDPAPRHRQRASASTPAATSPPPGPYVVGLALGAAPTPMDAIRWVALVPLVGALRSCRSSSRPAGAPPLTRFLSLSSLVPTIRP